MFGEHHVVIDIQHAGGGRESRGLGVSKPGLPAPCSAPKEKKRKQKKKMAPRVQGGAPMEVDLDIAINVESSNGEKCGHDDE